MIKKMFLALVAVVINFSAFSEIKKGDVIGQAIFMKYLITDDDKAEGERVGGFGSTNK